MLQSMGSQRVGHGLVTEQQQQSKAIEILNVKFKMAGGEDSFSFNLQTSRAK